ncbi:hypothetical protein GCM10010321_30210 [Streptomyces chartreusis]|nr:hypothetical protein GCM10010321_30210 [Streptomyces chartreusis]
MYVTPPREGSTACGASTPWGEFMQLSMGAHGSSGTVRPVGVSLSGGMKRKELDRRTRVGRMMERPQTCKNAQKESP